MILDDVCGLVDDNLASLIHTVIVLLKIGIPILLIVFGMLDFGKGVIAGKEDEIKSGQRMFIKRAISAFLVFFVVTIVQTVIELADDKNSDNESDAWNCANLIMNGPKKTAPKEKTNEVLPEPKIQYTQAANGTWCTSENAAADYNICIQNITSVDDTDKKVCGTIFNSYCQNEYEQLWHTNEKYTDEIVNQQNWQRAEIIRHIEAIKQSYYDCVQSGLGKEGCENYFKGFYKAN